MNKFIAWNNETNKMVQEFCAKSFLRTNYLGQPINIYQSTGKTDIHGEEIYYDFHIVRYYLHSAGDYSDLSDHIGIFAFDNKELRTKLINNHWEINYDNILMSNFEIIGNVKENPELIGEGK